MANRVFKVIDGGSSDGKTVATYINTSAAGEGEGGSGGGSAVNLAKLETRVDHAYIWLGILTTAFGAVFLWFLSDFSAVRSDISNLNSNVAVQTKAIDDISKGVDRLNEKLDGATVVNSTTPAKRR